MRVHKQQHFLPLNTHIFFFFIIKLHKYRVNFETLPHPQPLFFFNERRKCHVSLELIDYKDVTNILQPNYYQTKISNQNVQLNLKKCIQLIAYKNYKVFLNQIRFKCKSWLHGLTYKCQRKSIHLSTHPLSTSSNPHKFLNILTIFIRSKKYII